MVSELKKQLDDAAKLQLPDGEKVIDRIIKIALTNTSSHFDPLLKCGIAYQITARSRLTFLVRGDRRHWPFQKVRNNGHMIWSCRLECLD